MLTHCLLRLLAMTTLVSLLSSCTAFFYQPTGPRRARLGEETPATQTLHQLPPAKEKIVAAVYKFRDLTGQYKQTETGTGFSTAVTQGTTNILLKALEESGWFVPIERENVSNLLNERKIVRSSVAQFKDGENLPPLLFAGIILEGGVVSYDANIITGGGGLQYFSAGGSAQYRQDRVTVYLRAVATKTGKILKTIYTSKTILSQSVNASLFRYVTFKRLLETETGLTITEPGQMAVTEAIEKAVEGLIVEGVRDGLWAAADNEAGPMKTVIDAYEGEKTRMSETDVYGMRPEINAPLFTIQPYAGAMRYYGDYARRSITGMYGASLGVNFTSKFGVQINGATGLLSSEGAFATRIASLEGNLVFVPMPFQRWSSLLFVGAGVISRTGTSFTNWQGGRHMQAQGGLGVQYRAGDLIGFRSTISYNQPFTDALDGMVAGTRNDYYLRGTLGITLNLGSIFRPKPTRITRKN
ncbi:CsgG/HfaB family protein [Spirosoma pomorum]